MNRIRNLFNPQQEFSLLRPASAAPPGALPELNLRYVADLGLANTLLALSPDPEHRQALEAIFVELCTDTAVITYRQDVLADLLAYPQLVDCFTGLLPTLDALSAYHYRSRVQDTSPLYEVAWRAGELENVVICITAMAEAFTAVGDVLQSTGLQALRQEVQRIQEDEKYQSLTRELPGLLETLRASRSVTIGVNLDPQLEPVEAALLSVNTTTFDTGTFLDRFFGKNKTRWSGLAPVHSVHSLGGPNLIGTPLPPEVRNPGGKINPLMVPLFRDLADVLDKVCQPITQALGQYVQINGRFLANLRADLLFYLAAYRLIKRLEAGGLPMTRPEIAPAADRVFTVRDNYNLNLALNYSLDKPQADLRQQVVANDVDMGDNGRIFLLTGPNQGGKTTYIQAVGLTQVLAQAGFYVPGTQACVSPVDAIFTHFPVEEKLERGTGRFGDEAQRFSEIFTQVTRHSLVLLNESLASTSAWESLYLAQDLLRILRRVGLRAIYATHMHELAANVDQLNSESEGDSLLVSLVASRIDDGGQGAEKGLARSYKVLPGKPLGRSYATELAQRYGISYEQLVALLQQRGIL
ncbi:MAG: hypothetical protein H6659_19860 [Ardenticatenaceae bacterium]|nr:hypothetical protein [Ardenticatenaceae bacterium]